jgi:hypothetical protein
MNKDAIAEAAKISGDLGVTQEILEGMQWAYADAVKVARTYVEAPEDDEERWPFWDSAVLDVADYIEQRSK